MWPFGLFGSLAAWELRRIARRGLATRVRLVLLYALFVAFLAFATYWFHHLPTRDVFFGRPGVLSPAELARFADSFALTLLEVQLVAVVALTPALAASAVSEEKYRQTLPLLLTTLLTDREIVFGKAAARIVFVLSALFAGLPVLMITQLFGGVSVGFLAAAYAVTTGTVVLCAALGVSAACYAPDLRSAVLRAYARVAVFVCGAFVPPLVLASPFAVLVVLAHEPLTDPEFCAVGFGSPLLQVLVGWIFLARAVRALRLRDATAGPPPVTAYPEPPKPAEPPLLQPEDEVPPDLPPIDAADPVLWKERCVGWRPEWALPTLSTVLGTGAGAGALVLFAWGAWTFLARLGRTFDPSEIERLSQQPGGLETGGWLLTIAGVLAAGRYLLPLAVGLSGAIAGERFRGTLDVLLATTLDRRTVLRAKVQAHAERGTAFAAIAVAAVGMAFIADAGIRVGLAAAGLAALAIVLVIALGAWLTVRCPSDSRAFRLSLPITMLVVGWPVLAWNLLRGDVPVPPQMMFWGLLSAGGACGAASAVLWAHAAHVLARGE
ncbi:ABC transporter permease subunit [Gemmata sp. G18]|uniref:ABC transporter permease subunit n=1 Tax=Gemmata palustris TaxID=2822762 RepID=A0ABS5BMQ8_9BACT|nr:ABC transporter permease subunit [Gemmata palustris]MBP3954178.1 ABC transporter permease subunit [Gemmata palustris]